MEPISAAMAAVAAIKTGIKLGRDIQSMGRDVGKLWGAIDEVNATHSKKKRNPFSSVEEEAMDTFMAKTKAADLEKELREIIIGTRGLNAWQELIKLRGEIRTRKRLEKEALLKKRRQMVGIAVGSVALLAGIAGLIVFVLWLLARHNAPVF
jgi:hypothetical protein|tara:strand:- start:5432 stop:5887 length:456 start_codon:yes stop_codon:yes gene_type:complete